MQRFKIVGQQPLEGTISVNGSKNAATPILVSTLLSPNEATVSNVPRIEDVNRIVELLQSVGARCVWTDEHTITINAHDVDPSKIDSAAVRKLRSSVLLMGALVGRCGTVSLPGPGGDQIGARPLDAHIEGFKELGISVNRDGDLYTLTRGKRNDVTFTLSEFSVTATENIVLASVLADGTTTTIHCAAADPSVQDLCWFLMKRGAKISGIGTHTLTIEGVRSLTAISGYAIMPDPVETGTFISLGAASRSPIRICNVAATFLRSELKKFKEVNVQYSLQPSTQILNDQYPLYDIAIQRSTQLQSIRSVHNMPYPGFSADLLQPFAVLLTQAMGTSLVHDWMYEGRLKYVEELNKMGAQIFIADPHRILITGPTNLYAAEITSYDIRTGASLFIASIIAAGTSTVGPAYQIDRGYEKLDERLNAIGSRIQRLDE